MPTSGDRSLTTAAAADVRATAVTDPRTESQRAVLTALAFRDGDLALGRLAACSEDTPDDQAFVEAARAAALRLEGRGNSGTWSLRAKRLAAEARDPVVRAFCSLPLSWPVDPAVQLPLVERVAAMVAPFPEDSLAAYVRVQLMESRATLGAPDVADLEDVWAQRARWPGLAARIASFRARRMLRAQWFESFDGLVEAGLEACGTHRGRVTARLRTLRIHGWIARGDTEKALAHARSTASLPPQVPNEAAVMYYELLRTHTGDVTGAIAGLQACLDHPGAPDTVAAALAMALLQAGARREAERVVARLQGTMAWRGPVALLLAAVGQLVNDDAESTVEAVRQLPPDEDSSRLLRCALEAYPQAGSGKAARLRHALAINEAGLGRPLEAIWALRPPEGLLPLGPFDVGEVLGRGAHGVVHSARHHRTGIAAAVKVLAVGKMSDLQGEARILARMRHPNVLGVYDVGRVGVMEAAASGGAFHEGMPWLAMERVRGGTLSALCGALSWAQARRILLAVLDGLAHAHGLGILHLDVKPSNVLLEASADGWVPRLADFGVASLLSRSASRVAGTPAYMSPEQWSGRVDALDGRADLYGLGALAIQLLTGHRPFRADSVEGYRHAHHHAPRPTVPGASPGLEGWLMQLLAVDPAARFPSAAAAAEALCQLEDETLALAEPGVESQDTFVLSTTWMESSAAEVAPRDVGSHGVLPRRTSHGSPTSPLLPLELAMARLDIGPLCGLEGVQEQLWSHLRDRPTRGSCVVQLDGPGRTLGEWIVRAAREVGLQATLLDADTEAALQDQLAHTPSCARGAPRVAEGLGRHMGAPSVLVLEPREVTRPLMRAWVARLAPYPVLVVTSEWSDPDHRIAIPRLSDGDVAAVLADRLPMTVATTRALAAHAMGNLDLAFAGLQRLVDAGEFGRDGQLWHAHVDRVTTSTRRALEALVGRLHRRFPQAARAAAGRAYSGTPPHPDHVDALRTLGLLDADGQLYEAAAEALRQAFVDDRVLLEQALPFAEAWLPRARLLALLGRGDDAASMLLDDAEQSIVLHDGFTASMRLDALADLGLPSPPRFFLLRARLMRLLGEEADYERYLSIASQAPETRYDALMLDLQRHGVEAWSPLLQQALELADSPDRRGKVWRKRGEAHALLGDWEASESAFATAFALGSPHVVAFSRLLRLATRLRATPQVRWWEACRQLVHDAPRTEPFVKTLQAMALTMEGREGADEALHGVPSQLATPGRLLMHVASGDVARAHEVLTGPMRPALDALPWSWTVFWWIGSDADPAEWESTLRRWPARRCGTVGRWVLERAIERSPSARAEALRATLREVTSVPPDDLPREPAGRAPLGDDGA